MARAFIEVLAWSPFLPKPVPRPVLTQALKQLPAGVNLPGLPGSGLAGGQDDSRPPPPPPPPKTTKKKAGPKKIAQQKIQVCSSKLTDIKCWSSKLQESALHLESVQENLCNETVGNS